MLASSDCFHSLNIAISEPMSNVLIQPFRLAGLAEAGVDVHSPRSDQPEGKHESDQDTHRHTEQKQLNRWDFRGLVDHIFSPQ